MKTIAMLILGTAMAGIACTSSSSTSSPPSPPVSSPKRGSVDIQALGTDVHIERNKEAGKGKLDVQTPSGDVHINREKE